MLGPDAFQLLCLAVLATAWAFLLRQGDDARALARDGLLLGAGAWLGEQTCIAWYAFYGYADFWWVRLGHIPLLVALIWPMVILSARQVVGALAPNARGLASAALVGLVVIFDASLVEVVAVRAGLWAWAEGGYLDVPLIGILGWGFYGAAASWWLDRARGPWRLALPLVALPLTHGLIQLAWWALFRWTLRDPATLGPTLFWAAFAALALAFALRARARGLGLPLDTALPRVLASAVFLYLLVTFDASDDTWLRWRHTALVAVPYLVATRWSRAPAPALAAR